MSRNGGGGAMLPRIPSACPRGDSMTVSMDIFRDIRTTLRTTDGPKKD